MRRVDRILGSTAFRLSIAYASLLIAAFLMAGFGVWSATRSVALQQSREHILSEMHFLRSELESEGVQGLISAIEHRELRPAALLYRLTATDGIYHAGDLPDVEVNLGWRFLDLLGREVSRRGALIVYSERLADGTVLSIGDDLERAESVRAEVLKSVVEVGAVSALLAVAIGLFVTRHALRRMRTLGDTLAAVSRGELVARAFVHAPARDDFDRLSAGINAMLDRIVTLVSNLRRVSMQVAHDLRTPLSHLSQDLELAAESSSAATLPHIESAQARVETLSRTLAAILGLAEIETQSARARFSKVDLRQIVETITSVYRPEVEACGGLLLARTEGDPLIIDGDADLLKQAVANLIENSMVHAGGASNISVECRAVANTWTLEVADDGPGIVERERARVLEPFARLDQSRSTPGTGLGLAIVAAVAQLHDAELRLEDAAPGLRVVLEGRSAPE